MEKIKERKNIYKTDLENYKIYNKLIILYTIQYYQ